MYIYKVYPALVEGCPLSLQHIQNTFNVVLDILIGRHIPVTLFILYDKGGLLKNKRNEGNIAEQESYISYNSDTPDSSDTSGDGDILHDVR